MTVFDEVLGKEVEVQNVITPEIGKELELKDPEGFAEIFKSEDEEKK